MPEPLSVTRMSFLPPPSASTVISVLRGARVDGVFDELFDDGIRPVDDLACRDAVVDFGGQNVDHLFSFQRTMS